MFLYTYTRTQVYTYFNTRIIAYKSHAQCFITGGILGMDLFSTLATSNFMQHAIRVPRRNLWRLFA